MSGAKDEAVPKYNIAGQSFQCKGHVHPNEDRFATCADLGGAGIVLLAAIDGHGGHTTAEIVESRLAQAITDTEAFRASPRRLEDAITQAYAALDEAARAAAAQDGACCTCALICGLELLVGWVGDCRCVLVEDGELVELTRDHHPDEPSERTRIETAGGFVQQGEDGKVRSYGKLAVSRALGDAVQQGPDSAVCCVPEFRRWRLSGRSSCMVLGSDGVFETLGSEAVVETVVKQQHLSAKGIARKVARRAAQQRDNYDDTTCLVVRLRGADGEPAGLMQDELDSAAIRELGAEASPSVTPIKEEDHVLPLESSREDAELVRVLGAHFAGDDEAIAKEAAAFAAAVAQPSAAAQALAAAESAEFSNMAVPARRRRRANTTFAPATPALGVPLPHAHSHNSHMATISDCEPEPETAIDPT
eukprot:COSAG01_NODE_5237_length_4391_cov_1.868390_1_plen_419_part_00